MVILISFEDCLTATESQTRQSETLCSTSEDARRQNYIAAVILPKEK
jgi:hypothetical protein